jgi:CRISPR-associated exonuclease Cas4
MNTKELIEVYLLKEAEEKKKEHVNVLNVFYPSSAGLCPRKLYNEKKNPTIFPVDTYKRFVLGNMVHEWLQSKIYSEGKCEESIKWTEEDIVISGRVDCIYEDCVLEFKSIAALGYVMDAPKPEHVAQLNLYLHALGMPKGKIVYVNKADLAIVEHEVTYDPKLYTKTIDSFRKVYKALREDMEPKPSKCPSPWACEYCRNDPKKVKGRMIGKAIKAKKARMKSQEKLPDATKTSLDSI